MRKESFGQKHKLTLTDKIGVYLSSYKIVNFVRKNKPDTIIDIGCGYNATILSSLKKYSNNLTGIDLQINPELKGIKKIEIKIDNKLDFLADQSADLIILNSTLEHFSYPQEILNEVFRILRRDGFAIINVPNWLGKIFLEFMAFNLHQSPINEIDDHKMYYYKKDIWPMLVRAGFSPSKIKIKYHKLFLNTICYAKR